MPGPGHPVGGPTKASLKAQTEYYESKNVRPTGTMTGEQFKQAMSLLLGEPWGTHRAAEMLNVDDRAIQRMAKGEIYDATASEILAMLRERRCAIDEMLR